MYDLPDSDDSQVLDEFNKKNLLSHDIVMDMPTHHIAKYLETVANFRYLAPCLKNYIFEHAQCERYNPGTMIKVKDEVSSLDFLFVFKGVVNFKLKEITADSHGKLTVFTLMSMEHIDQSDLRSDKMYVPIDYDELIIKEQELE